MTYTKEEVFISSTEMTMINVHDNNAFSEYYKLKDEYSRLTHERLRSMIGKTKDEIAAILEDNEISKKKLIVLTEIQAFDNALDQIGISVYKSLEDTKPQGIIGGENLEKPGEKHFFRKVRIDNPQAFYEWVDAIQPEESSKI